jgi:hypothetical protein
VFSYLATARSTTSYNHNVPVYIYEYWAIVAAPIAIYSLVLGFRYDVGVDFLQYWTIHEYLQIGQLYRPDIDPFYLFTDKVLVFFGLGPWSIFLLTSFLFIGAYYFLLRKHRDILLFSMPMYLVSTFDAENLVRQFFAISLLIVGVSFLLQRRIWIYFAFSALAFLTHSSCILAIISFLLLWKLPKAPLFVFLTLYVFAWIIGPSIFEAFRPVINFCNAIGLMQNYTENVDTIVGNDRMDLFGSASVYSQAFQFVCNASILYFGYQLIEKYRKQGYLFFYYAFAIAITLKPMFQRHELFNRFVHYFSVFSPVIYGYVAYEVFKQSFGNSVVRMFAKAIVISAFAFSIYSFYCGLNADALTMGHGYTFFWERHQ